MDLPNKLVYFLISAVVVLTTLLYGTVHQPILVLFYVVIAVMALLWALDCFRSGTIRFSRHPLQLPLILLGIYGLIQVIRFGSTADEAITGIPRTISIDPFATQVTALHILALAVFFGLALVYFDSAARLRRVANVLVVFGFIYAFFAIVQSGLSPNKIYGIYEPQAGTPFGSFVNRHNFAAIIEMAVSIPLGLIFTGAVERDKRLLYFVAIALMTASLLLSGSRGGLVALLAAIIFLVIITSRARGRRSLLLKAGLSILLVGAAIGGAVFVGGETSLTRFADASSSSDVTSNRMQIWSVTLKVIAHNFPLGAGLGAFVSAYPPHDAAGGFERVDQAHNDYLQLAADAGLVGILIGGMFAFWFIRTAKRSIAVPNTFRRGIATGALTGCFAILVHSVFDFVLHITAISVMFLTLLAMLVASGREYADDIEDPELPRSTSRRSAGVTSIADSRRSSA